MQWTAHIACTLKIKNEYTPDIGKLQRHNLLVGYRHIYEENIQMAS